MASGLLDRAGLIVQRFFICVGDRLDPYAKYRCRLTSGSGFGARGCPVLGSWQTARETGNSDSDGVLRPMVICMLGLSECGEVSAPVGKLY